MFARVCVCACAFARVRLRVCVCVCASGGSHLRGAGGGEHFAEIDALEVAFAFQKPTEKLGGIGFFFFRMEREGQQENDRRGRKPHQKLTLI